MKLKITIFTDCKKLLTLSKLDIFQMILILDLTIYPSMQVFLSFNSEKVIISDRFSFWNS